MIISSVGNNCTYNRVENFAIRSIQYWPSVGYAVELLRHDILKHARYAYSLTHRLRPYVETREPTTNPSSARLKIPNRSLRVAVVLLRDVYAACRLASSSSLQGSTTTSSSGDVCDDREAAAAADCAEATASATSVDDSTQQRIN